MALTQALGSDAAATGLSPDEPLRARGGLLEFQTIADAARSPPRDPVVLERA